MGQELAKPGDGERLAVAAISGDEGAFEAVSERYRRELQLHCYRMLGSLQDAEDAVQETMLRAWRSRQSFTSRGPTSFRAWLYRVATNVCLDMLARHHRKRYPWQPGSQSGPAGRLLGPDGELAWLQPYPDHLLDGVAPQEEQPDRQLVSRETIELAFIVVIQLLPPSQRAVLILRDIVGWSARETAALLEMTVVAVNSALQRARSTLKQYLPKRASEWSAPSEPTDDEVRLVRRYTEAHETGDFATMARLLHADARLTMPPTPSWFEGADAIAGLFAAWRQPDSPDYVGDVRRVPIAANRQFGWAGYLRRPDDSAYRPLGLEFIRIEGERIAELTMFVSGELFAAFGLPPTL